MGFHNFIHMSRVSCQKGPTRHAYAWQIGPFWQGTLDVPWTWTMSASTKRQPSFVLLWKVCLHLARLTQIKHTQLKTLKCQIAIAPANIRVDVITDIRASIINCIHIGVRDGIIHPCLKGLNHPSAHNHKWHIAFVSFLYWFVTGSHCPETMLVRICLIWITSYELYHDAYFYLWFNDYTHKRWSKGINVFEE